MKIFVKIHDLYKKVVAICDFELIGKVFYEENIQLKTDQNFYSGKECTREQAKKLLEYLKQEDACFNFVGQNSVELGAELEILDINSCLRIQGIPHAIAVL